MADDNGQVEVQDGEARLAALDVEHGEFAAQIADQVESFLIALNAIAREESAGVAVPMLLLEVSQILLAGARLGVQQDFNPVQEFQPDVGPEPEGIDDLRISLAKLLDNLDTYSFVFDPYLPEVVEGQLSDDMVAIAADLDNGLRHYRLGNVAEALWWWQFSYVSNWGNLAGAALNALLAVITHDRLDAEFTGEDEEIAVAEEILGE
ncbi:DUF5063 domain-containing protein [Nocardioides phosphati]|uniref:DUF5063 domain-containing protein n=1 Tax=Nocardioides phosphati TaxID=1867775 RepID=A0ABQ2NAK6_9ACTN|nr:DUF5063 domain-containing protein [Nocardioides phosphati]GGO89305.1 DUF5063 domain-containing protein [Nocardioides phosphati]